MDPLTKRESEEESEEEEEKKLYVTPWVQHLVDVV
jgi:hypothetical protein